MRGTGLTVRSKSGHLGSGEAWSQVPLSGSRVPENWSDPGIPWAYFFLSIKWYKKKQRKTAWYCMVHYFVSVIFIAVPILIKITFWNLLTVKCQLKYIMIYYLVQCFFLYSVKSLENRLAFFQYLISIVARQKNDFLF